MTEMSPEWTQEPLFALGDAGLHDVLYSEAELARAYREIERIIPEYDVEKLARACLQARKNRVWDRSQK